MAKKATPTPTITPDENLEAEVSGLTPNPFEKPVATTTQPQAEIKVEFKQPTYEASRFTTIYANLHPKEVSEIHAALVANSDKQPETRIFLFLRSLEEIGIKYGRISVKD